MSKIVLDTGPSGDVVSIGDLKKDARITSSRQDATLRKLHDEAVAVAEEYLWGKLLTQTWTEYFDGFTDPPDDLKDASELPRLTQRLVAEGYSQEAIIKILGDNALRVLREGWGRKQA